MFAHEEIHSTRNCNSVFLFPTSGDVDDRENADGRYGAEMDADVVDDDRLSATRLIKREEKCGDGREKMSAQLLPLPERG